MDIKKNYSTFLFDADGTLIDTAELIIRSYKHTLPLFGIAEPSREEVVRDIGIPFLNQLANLTGPIPQEKTEAIYKYYRQYQMDKSSEHLKAFPETRETLERLKEKGAKLGVVTSRSRISLEQYLEILGIYSFFDVIITPESVENPKPHREPTEKALLGLNANAQDSLFIGDATYDQQSALGAGVDFAYVTWSHIPVERFSPTPDLILQSMDELVTLAMCPDQTPSS